jgi:hypothetical protein
MHDTLRIPPRALAWGAGLLVGHGLVVLALIVDLLVHPGLGIPYIVALAGNDVGPLLLVFEVLLAPFAVVPIQLGRLVAGGMRGGRLVGATYAGLATVTAVALAVELLRGPLDALGDQIVGLLLVASLTALAALIALAGGWIRRI